MIFSASARTAGSPGLPMLSCPFAAGARHSAFLPTSKKRYFVSPSLYSSTSPMLCLEGRASFSTAFVVLLIAPLL